MKFSVRQGFPFVSPVIDRILSCGLYTLAAFGDGGVSLAGKDDLSIGCLKIELELAVQASLDNESCHNAELFWSTKKIETRATRVIATSLQKNLAIYTVKPNFCKSLFNCCALVK